MTKNSVLRILRKKGYKIEMLLDWEEKENALEIVFKKNWKIYRTTIEL